MAWQLDCPDFNPEISFQPPIESTLEEEEEEEQEVTAS